MLTQKGAQQSCQCTNHELVHRPGAYQSADRLCRLFTSQRPPTPNSPLVSIETHPVISASLTVCFLPSICLVFCSYDNSATTAQSRFGRVLGQQGQARSFSEIHFHWIRIERRNHRGKNKYVKAAKASECPIGVPIHSGRS